MPLLHDEIVVVAQENREAQVAFGQLTVPESAALVDIREVHFHDLFDR